MDRENFRKSVLARHGASDEEVVELLRYNANLFDHARLAQPLSFPLPDEPFVSAWREYAAASSGTFNVLKEHLAQLNFPVREGISRTEGYRRATLSGVSAETIPEATGLELEEPEAIRLFIHPTPAGHIPVMVAGSRADFVSLVRALLMKNEPAFVPDSRGGAAVSGYNNWGRIRWYREDWERENPSIYPLEAWREEFERLIPRKELDQDRFLILSDGPYSNVPASDMGLADDEWKRLSLAIRLEHESTHYFTQRLFGSMRDCLFDELLADYRGIIAASGRYHAQWALRFLGLESFPIYRKGGRLENYPGNPPLSTGAFRILQSLVKDAAENLERIDIDFRGGRPDWSMLIALSRMTLEELASEEACERFETCLKQSPSV
ncbi:MAG: DUF7005 family protein [Acidobacteriota bacterium]